MTRAGAKLLRELFIMLVFECRISPRARIGRSKGSEQGVIRRQTWFSPTQDRGARCRQWCRAGRALAKTGAPTASWPGRASQTEASDAPPSFGDARHEPRQPTVI